MDRLKFSQLIILVCLLVFFISTQKTAAQKDGLLKIYFLSVGQGDAEFIETPNGHQILIDGGPGNSVLSELSQIMPFYDRDIDVVIASHPHSDHIEGLIHVLDRYDVDHVVRSKNNYDSSQFKEWGKAIGSEGAREVEAALGTVIDFGDGTKISIAYPFESYEGISLKNPHDANVSVILEYKDFKTFFAGDMEGDGEEKLIKNKIPIDSDVLKIGHHGSKTSTTEEFLKTVTPSLAIIEVGKNNRYRLPYPGVLKRLETFKIPYYRTDLDGTVKIFSDGKQFQVFKSGS